MTALPDLPLAYAAYLIGTASPGPSVLAVMGTAMAQGRTRALALAAGVVCGSQLWGLSAALGMAAVMRRYSEALTMVKLAGGLYLLWLAWQAARTAGRGLALHLTNPKPIFVWLSSVSLALPPGARQALEPGALNPATEPDNLQRIIMPTFLKRTTVALLLCLVAHAVAAAEPPVFAYAVICDDPALAQRLRSGVEERFARLHVQLRKQLPNAKLFIYANRDKDDDKNPDGVSVAIAHTSNLEAAQLALSFVDRKEAPPLLLQSMLGEEGMLLHLRVAHLSAPSDKLVDGLLDEVVTSFVHKYTPQEAAPAPGR